jgi:hypothetical protein
MPIGQRHCARDKSIPMARRSISGNPFSHSRTGSIPEAARKKTSGTFSGFGASFTNVLYIIHCTLKHAYRGRAILADSESFSQNGMNVRSLLADDRDQDF